jgi:SAM-dependent methyltransferase
MNDAASFLMKGHAIVSTVTPAPQPDFNLIKQRQQQIWSSGNYTEVGSRLVIMSERLCENLDLRAGQRVLDVASGTGNAALAAARRFCNVTSTDYVPELLERGKLRAEAEGLPVTFEVADAENLPYPDASFDVVLSVIGAMFAPNQRRTAGELLRVCRSGGKIGMANWTPDGLAGMFFQMIGKYLPPPPGLTPPTRWGTEEGVRELLGDGAASIEIAHRNYTFRFHSLEHLIDFLKTNFGPFKTACEALDPQAQEDLIQDMRARAASLNRCKHGTIVVDSGYLEVVAVRA